MIKRVLTFVSGVQESVLVDVISQNKVKILHKVKILFIKHFLTKTSLDFFQFLSCYYNFMRSFI